LIISVTFNVADAGTIRVLAPVPPKSDPRIFRLWRLLSFSSENGANFRDLF